MQFNNLAHAEAAFRAALTDPDADNAAEVAEAAFYYVMAECHRRGQPAPEPRVHISAAMIDNLIGAAALARGAQIAMQWGDADDFTYFYDPQPDGLVRKSYHVDDEQESEHE